MYYSFVVLAIARTSPLLTGSQRTQRRTSQPAKTGNDLTETTVEAQVREITSILENQQILVTLPRHSGISKFPAARELGEEDIETPISTLPPFSSSSGPFPGEIMRGDNGW